jgi:hypothetical protein
VLLPTLAHAARLVMLCVAAGKGSGIAPHSTC